MQNNAYEPAAHIRCGTEPKWRTGYETSLLLLLQESQKENVDSNMLEDED